LQEIVDYLGITELPFRRTTRSLPIDTSNPFFDRDLNKCILCGKCVRVCDEVVGVDAIALTYRGYTSKVATFGDKLIIDSDCVSCGECVAHCPVAALMPKKAEPPTEEVATTCPYCGVGCGIYLGICNGQVVSVRGRRDGTVNNGCLCVKGRFGIIEFVHHRDRLKAPLIKKEGGFVEGTWDEALELVCSKLGSYKPDEVALISSAKCSNEENYVAQKFARAVLGTNNIDHCARLCHAPSVAGLAQSFGSGAMTNSINEVRDSRCILAIGTNTTEAHPIIGLEVKKAVENGAKLIVANPREIDLVRFSHIWLKHRPGSDVALLMGMAKVIVDEGLLDRSFIDERCEDFDAFLESLKGFDLDFAEQATGVDKEKVAQAARVYAVDKPSTILYAMGITQHSHGTDNVIATANLAMLTGNIGKPSSGVNPLRGQNNVQGACDMGALPNVYTGYQAVADADIRKKFESAWGCKLPAKPGLTITEIFDAAYRGKIKALYVIGENPLLSEPDITHARGALERLDFLVVQDIFLSETAQLADVVLAGASFAEKDGTFTNTERRVQRVRKALEPVGDSKPDWWITCELGRRMGKGFDFSHPSEIMEEISQLTPSYGGISYERLDNGGLQWPCPTKDHPGTPILHRERFTRGKGKFIPLSYKPSKELPDDEYPLVLTTGRSLYHFHTGTMTRKVSGLNVLRGEGEVEINPGDASNLGVRDGEKVKVISRRGEVVARAKLTEASPAGVVFMTFHFAESPANMLTNPAVDPVAKIPEYKVCAVRIERM
jgi:formate dehydrogenase alpha subunit